MNNKVLVLVYVPMIEANFDIYIPTTKKIGSVKNLIMDIVSNETDGAFNKSDTCRLFDKQTGDVLDENLYVKQSNIKNGMKLILY